MPVLLSLSPVLFHGDTIFVANHQGEPFAPVRPIIENIGLVWGTQQQKLHRNSARWGVFMMNIPSASGLQKTLCIPVRKLAGFLATINPSRVREELRAKIIQYQNECDDALWNYWTKGSATRSESSASQPTQPDLPLDDSSLLSESERDLLGTIKALDEDNRQLSSALKETRVSYIKLLESHIFSLRARLKTQNQGFAPNTAPEQADSDDSSDSVRYYINPDEHEAMRKMFKEGYSVNEISRAFGRIRRTVYRHIKGARA